MNHLSVTKVGKICLAFTLTLVSGSVALRAQAPTADASDKVLSPAELQVRQTWRQTMHTLRAPSSGCFHASFPNTEWEEVGCDSPAPFLSMPPTSTGPQTTGNGYDYVAQAPTGHFINSALGYFPGWKNLKSEKDNGASNEYSLQLNTNVDHNSPACNGYSGCFSWQQYLLVSNYYAIGASGPSGKTEVFIQDWLINYGHHNGKNICPSGWTDFGKYETGDQCARNSKAAVVYNGQLPISQLGELELGGTANTGGSDEVEVFYGKEAFKVSNPDSRSDIATDWSQVEFNVVGNGGGSKAVFNSGAELLVEILLDYGSSSSPKCQPPSKHLGSTGETNNMTLGKCVAGVGQYPYVEFIEAD